jgi:hypothetical protein
MTYLGLVGLSRITCHEPIPLHDSLVHPWWDRDTSLYNPASQFIKVLLDIADPLPRFRAEAGYLVCLRAQYSL